MEIKDTIQALLIFVFVISAGIGATTTIFVSVYNNTYENYGVNTSYIEESAQTSEQILSNLSTNYEQLTQKMYEMSANVDDPSALLTLAIETAYSTIIQITQLLLSLPQLALSSVQVVLNMITEIISLLPEPFETALQGTFALFSVVLMLGIGISVLLAIIKFAVGREL